METYRIYGEGANCYIEPSEISVKQNSRLSFINNTSNLVKMTIDDGYFDANLCEPQVDTLKDDNLSAWICPGLEQTLVPKTGGQIGDCNIWLLCQHGGGGSPARIRVDPPD